MEHVIKHLNSIYTHLKPSNIDGVGTFALKPIKRGTEVFPIWSYETGYYNVSIEESKLESKIKLELLKYYTVNKHKIIKILLIQGVNYTTPWRHYVNHFHTPNISEHGIALRDIKEGEEIVRDYMLTHNTKEKTVI
jgi:SET domain-containing protein